MRPKLNTTAKEFYEEYIVPDIFTIIRDITQLLQLHSYSGLEQETVADISERAEHLRRTIAGDRPTPQPESLSEKSFAEKSTPSAWNIAPFNEGQLQQSTGTHKQDKTPLTRHSKPRDDDFINLDNYEIILRLTNEIRSSIQGNPDMKAIALRCQRVENSVSFILSYPDLLLYSKVAETLQRILDDGFQSPG